MPIVVRALRNTGALLALALVAAVVTALGVGSLAALRVAGDGAVAGSIAELRGVDVELQLLLPPADARAGAEASSAVPDVEADAVVDRLVDGTAARAGAPLLRAERARVSVDVVGVAGNDRAALRLVAVDDLPDRAALLSGAWPAGGDTADVAPADGPVPSIALDEAAAAAVGAAPGDVVAVGDVPARVAAVVRALPAAPSVLTVTDGSDAGAGVAVVPRALLDAVAASGPVYTVTPIPGAVGVDDLDPLRAGLDALPGLVADRLDVDVDRSGRLPLTTARLAAARDAAQAAWPVGAALLGVALVVALSQLAGAAAAARAPVTALVRARGASTVRICVADGVPALLASSIGAALGAAAAAATGLLAPAPQTIAVAFVVAGVGPAVVVAVTARQIRRSPGDGSARGGAGRGTAAALLTAAGALAAARLTIAGTPLRDGGGVDPLSAAAPALVLAAAAVLGAAAAPSLLGPVARSAGRGRSAAPVLVARSLARRSVSSVPVVLVALAVGSLVLAVAVPATFRTADATARELRLGAAIRVDGDDVDRVLPELARVRGVTGAAPVLGGATTIGATPATLVAVTSTAWDGLARPPQDDGSLGGAAVDLALPELAGPGALTVEVAAAAPAVVDAVSLVLVDRFGVTTVAPLTPSAGGAFTGDDLASAGSGDDGTRVAAIDVTVTSGDGGTPVADARVEVTGIGPVDADPVDAGPATGASASPVPLAAPTGAWRAASAEPGAVPLVSPATGAAFEAQPGTATIRLLPALPLAPPAVVSAAFAADAGIAAGDPLTTRLDPGSDDPTRFTIAAVLPAIPGADDASAVLVDADLLRTILLTSTVDPPTADSVWLGARDIAATADAVRAAAPAGARVQQTQGAAEQTLLGGGSPALGAAAAAAVAAALLGVGAAAAAGARARRGERVLLRALGLTAPRIGRMRAAEAAVTAALGGVAGLAGGLVAAAATVPPLVSAAVPDGFPSIPVALELPPLPVAVGVVAIALAATAVGALAGRDLLMERRRRPGRRSSAAAGGVRSGRPPGDGGSAP